ncbi:hypothetical protein [Kozakia baliensis]|uniref:hypothetical protein n=1 Tax=Kozakia baliensis TaxID=153496 RepID=UPI0011DFB47B|nr:hypothetical protein [Kozakia baliensis]
MTFKEGECLVRPASLSYRKPRALFPQAPSRWVCTDAPVTCRRCRMEWRSGDPALTLACRGCDAPAGAPCQRSQGGNERACHQRDADAQRLRLMAPCDGLSWDGRHDKPARLYPVPVTGAMPVLSGAPVSKFFD